MKELFIGQALFEHRVAERRRQGPIGSGPDGQPFVVCTTSAFFAATRVDPNEARSIFACLGEFIHNAAAADARCGRARTKHHHQIGILHNGGRARTVVRDSICGKSNFRTRAFAVAAM